MELFLNDELCWALQASQLQAGCAFTLKALLEPWVLPTLRKVPGHPLTSPHPPSPHGLYPCQGHALAPSTNQLGQQRHTLSCPCPEAWRTMSYTPGTSWSTAHTAVLRTDVKAHGAAIPQAKGQGGTAKKRVDRDGASESNSLTCYNI